jgi:hypothetical protein
MQTLGDKPDYDYTAENWAKIRFDGLIGKWKTPLEIVEEQLIYTLHRALKSYCDNNDKLYPCPLCGKFKILGHYRWCSFERLKHLADDKYKVSFYRP